MAIIDSVLVDVIILPLMNVSIPTYINRDKVIYYGKYMDPKGNVSEDLTNVIFPGILQVVPPSDVPLIVKMSLADFHVLMTT